MTTLHESALQAAAEAIAESEIGYEIKLTKFIDGVSEYSVTFPDGSEPRTFPGYSSASEYVERERNLAKAKAAVEAYLAIVDGWNDDMSKAPRDRSAILLVTNTGRVTVGHWLDNSQTCVPWMGWSTDAGPFVVGRITHWRPLPAPPSIRSDDREGGR